MNQPTQEKPEILIVTWAGRCGPWIVLLAACTSMALFCSYCLNGMQHLFSNFRAEGMK